MTPANSGSLCVCPGAPDDAAITIACCIRAVEPDSVILCSGDPDLGGDDPSLGSARDDANITPPLPFAFTEGTEGVPCPIALPHS